MAKSTTAVCTAVHLVDLEDGRTLAPGESADVDVSTDYNQSLIDSGMLTVIEQTKPQHTSRTPDGEGENH